MAVCRFREITSARLEEFLRKGYHQRHFFPHRIHHLSKCGPDGWKLARRMVRTCRLADMWELVLYATGPAVDEFPDDLYFDRELIWHRQQFGRRGQVATANLLQQGSLLYSMVHLSDLVQRIARRREHKTRIENRFKGWPVMLLNAVLNFARERRLSPVYTPTADLALRHTDPTRTVRRPLFERIYDDTVTRYYRAVRENDWWRIDVPDNLDRVLIPEAQEEDAATGTEICIAHDIEAGLGHVDVDAAFAAAADRAAGRHLDGMLAVEAERGLLATYNVVGQLLEGARERIESQGHSLGFHSYDHRVEAAPNLWRRLRSALSCRDKTRNGERKDTGLGQLERCRQIDYRIRGYRPARSRLTPEHLPENLCFHNFEWFASSEYSMRLALPALADRIVRIPITTDDFALHMRRIEFAEWKHRIIQLARQRSFLCISLHDCYAPHWLPRYRELLDDVQSMATIRTFDEIADRVFLTEAA